MKKILIAVAVLAIVGCCPRPQYFEYKLVDSQLTFIPYQDKDIVVMKYNNQAEITFTSTLSKYYEDTFCERCCKTITSYEVLQVMLSPDYPIDKIYLKVFALQDGLQISCFNTSFLLKSNQKPDFDSLQINQKIYRNVFKLTKYYCWNEEIYADTIYYNKINGVLKIIMSNKKNYIIYE